MTEHNLLDDTGHEAGIHVTEEAQSSLRTAATWSTFLAILGFIMLGFMVLAGLVVLAFMGTINDVAGASGQAFPIWIIPILYLVLAAVYFFPILYLYRFASRTKSALRSHSSGELTVALNNLGKHYKWMGIMVIALIALYIIFYAVFFSFFAAMGAGGLGF